MIEFSKLFSELTEEYDTEREFNIVFNPKNVKAETEAYLKSKNKVTFTKDNLDVVLSGSLVLQVSDLKGGWIPERTGLYSY